MKWERKRIFFARGGVGVFYTLTSFVIHRNRGDWRWCQPDDKDEWYYEVSRNGANTHLIRFRRMERTE